MRVKINDMWYDADTTDIIMVEFTDMDKENIANMLPQCYKYCCYNAGEFTEQEVHGFMETSPERAEYIAEHSVITDEHR